MGEGAAWEVVKNINGNRYTSTKSTQLFLRQGTEETVGISPERTAAELHRAQD